MRTPSACELVHLTVPVVTALLLRRLRRKLQQALALLRTYQHKLRVTDAAMTSMEHQQTQTQPAHMSARQTQTDMEPMAKPAHTEQPTGARCPHCCAAAHTAEALMAAAQAAAAAARADEGGGAAAPSQQRCSPGLQAAHSPALAAPMERQESDGAQSAGHACCSLGGPPLLATGHSLRFDPAAGECGAFFIVNLRSSRPAAATWVEGPGPSTPPLQSHSHQPSVAAGPGGCRSAEGSRNDGGASCHQASAMSVLHRQSFDGSLIDLVAEVDDMVSQAGEKTVHRAADWSAFSDSCRDYMLH